MSLFRMQSMFSGKVNEMEIPITYGDHMYWVASGELIQNVFPHLTPEQREFLKTGMTPEEWDAACPPEEEYDVPEDYDFGPDEPF